MTHRAIVVGTGFGCRIQIPALLGAGFEVVGLVGADPGRTAERAEVNGVPAAFTDIGEAISATGATVAAISTPPHLHSAAVLTSLDKGCHVLAEKPFAANTADAQRMLDAAERKGVAHLIGHEFRFVPQRALVARAIAEGVIGDPLYFTLVGLGGFVADHAGNFPAWWFDPKEGGGWLGASGSHTIDQIRAEVGEFDSVSAALPTLSPKIAPVDDSYVFRFRLTNGVEGMVQHTTGAAGPPLNIFRVSGSKGTLWTEGADVWVADDKGSRKLSVPADLQLPPPPPLTADPRHATPDWQFMAPLELAPYTRLCRYLKDSIEGVADRGRVAPATFADGVACMKVIDAIRASAAQGGALVKVS